MKKLNYFLFAGLIIMVMYTIFAIQNKISVPVRFTFGEPKVYFLPLIVLVGFVGGGIFCSIFILIYRLNLTKSRKFACNIQAYPVGGEDRAGGMNNANSHSSQPSSSPCIGNNSDIVQASISHSNNCMQTPVPDLEYGQGLAVSNHRIPSPDKEAEIPYSNADEFVTKQSRNILRKIKKIILGRYKKE